MSTDAPERLFHYTNAVGLDGILRSKTLWATHIAYLNDGSEFAYLYERLKAIWLQRKESAKAAPDLVELFERYFLSKQHNPIQQFVVSFTRWGDRLSQWRGYAGHGGYCIGFDRAQLDEIATRCTLRLVECVYDQGRQDDLIRAAIGEAFEGLEANREKFGESEMAQWVHSAFYQALDPLAPVLKDPAFDEEGEWRLVSDVRTAWNRTVAGTQDLRVSASGVLVPYLKIPLVAEKDADGRPCQVRIPTIRVGPSPHADLAFRTLHEMRQRTYPHRIDEVTRSRIPYRPL